MITKEHEYIPEDAADDSHKALSIGNPANRTAHYTVAILRGPEGHTSLEFTRIRKTRIADAFQLVMHDLLQSICHPLVLKQAATDRFQLKTRDVVAMVPLRPRSTECETIARPHSETCMKMRAVAKIVNEDGMHPKNFSPTLVATANYMHGTRQLAQILLNQRCLN